ncbi:Protein CBG26099 [Caenorhabditis briggsae]|uniref:Protein CBG26099 n=1 Tax=Caenorhabditis briggsae TaxID=6238 RepID=B6IM84_CAEBR|nr:Protein CBG26099 [Caenorhabditis briggsae]CAS01014.1 Protein CBG26099 [Caenorhabditis briggsae]
MRKFFMILENLTTVILILYTGEAYGQLVPFEDFRCGSGSLSTSISYTSSYFCDQIQLNQCCMYHDLCYAGCTLPQMECDNQFCECLSTIISNPFCMSIVYPSHCNFVRLFGNLFICPMMG